MLEVFGGGEALGGRAAFAVFGADDAPTLVVADWTFDVWAGPRWDLGTVTAGARWDVGTVTAGQRFDVGTIYGSNDGYD